MPADVSDLFDRPSAWRARVALDLGLTGDDLRAGCSTSSAMPQLLRPASPHLDASPAGMVVDIGGGLGSVSAWVRERTGRPVLLVDPSATSCELAVELFDLRTVCAAAASLPLARASAAILIVNGVVSLLDDLEHTIDELVRVAAPGCALVIADLMATDRAPFADGPNTFWPLHRITHALEQRGIEVVEFACAEPGVGDWGPVQAAVSDEIARRYADRDGFAEWQQDADRLAGLLADERVAPGALVAVIG